MTSPRNLKAVSERTVIRAAQLRLSELHYQAADEASHRMILAVESALDDASRALELLACSELTHNHGHNRTDTRPNSGLREWRAEDLHELALKDASQLAELVRLLGVALAKDPCHRSGQLVRPTAHISNTLDADVCDRLVKVAEECEQILTLIGRQLGGTDD